MENAARDRSSGSGGGLIAPPEASPTGSVAALMGGALARDRNTGFIRQHGLGRSLCRLKSAFLFKDLDAPGAHLDTATNPNRGGSERASQPQHDSGSTPLRLGRAALRWQCLVAPMRLARLRIELSPALFSGKVCGHICSR